MDMQLNNKVILITGGTSGIGLATALRFLQEGAKVMLCALNAQRGEQCLKDLEEYTGRLAFVAADVAKVSECKNAVDTAITTFGGLDVVVNSAGVYKVHQITDINEDDYDWMMNTNLKGTYFICKYAIEHFKTTGGGSIVNISSDAGLQGNYDSSVYCASKGAVEIMSKALALDHAKENIRVNCVAPGDIRTPMLEKDLAVTANPEQYLKDLTDPYPVGRLGEADEVATAVVFLASSLSTFTTGSSWSVDGGIMAY